MDFVTAGNQVLVPELKVTHVDNSSVNKDETNFLFSESFAEDKLEIYFEIED
jgi:hypothetical protein